MTQAPDITETPAKAQTKPPMLILMVEPKEGQYDYVLQVLRTVRAGLDHYGYRDTPAVIHGCYGPFPIEDAVDGLVFTALGWHGDGHDKPDADPDTNSLSNAVRHAAREMAKAVTTR